MRLIEGRSFYKPLPGLHPPAGDENPMCMLHTEPYPNVRGYKGEAVCVEMNGFCNYGERKKGAQRNEL